MEVDNNASDHIIPSDDTAATTDVTASIPTEQMPLLNDPDSGVLESELIARDCAAVDAQVQLLRDQTAQQQTQVTSFPLFQMSMHCTKS
jgi:hypothetical protein